MIYREPVWPEEIARQPLMWCRWIRGPKGGQLGERTHIEWARWDIGPTPSFLQWSMFRHPCLAT